jgi:excisionase family DNA binding protein
MDERLLTTQEAADYLGLSETTLRIWRGEDRGPRWIKINYRTIRYRLSDIDDWLKTREVGNGRT